MGVKYIKMTSNTQENNELISTRSLGSRWEDQTCPMKPQKYYVSQQYLNTPLLAVGDV